MSGMVTIEYNDGKGETIDASKCVVIRSDKGEPRDMIALREVLRVLDGLTPREAGRVLVWASDAFHN